jgi:PPOX class probable F420-dependent enzyme
MSKSVPELAGKKYISLESYRKNGQPVRTPVWFVQENGTIYIYTLASAYKVARIRKNPRVRLAACDARGKVKGDWLEGRARLVDGDEEKQGHALLDNKYGWAKKLGNLYSGVLKRPRVVIAIELIQAGVQGC